MHPPEALLPAAAPRSLAGRLRVLAGLVALGTAPLAMLATAVWPRAAAARPSDPVERAAAAPAPAAPAPWPPERLAETGLLLDEARFVLAPDVRPFTPQYPLWTDGAAKRRWIRLPPGASIDATDPDAWIFPVGTRLWKEFAWERRVETRFLERRADGSWAFASYVWSADGREARLAPAEGLRAVHPLRPGAAHDVPSRQDCLACHGGRPTPVLGFSALQLSPDRDPLAPHAERPEPGALDLDTLRGEGLLRATAALPRAPRAPGRTPRERAALGYLHGNCAACHHGRGSLAELGLDLEVRVSAPPAGAPAGLPPGVATTVDVASRYRLPGRPGQALPRLAPGDPDRSVLLARLLSRFAALQMPPLGTRVRDDEALSLLTAWVRDDLAAPAHPSPTSE